MGSALSNQFLVRISSSLIMQMISKYSWKWQFSQLSEFERVSESDYNFNWILNSLDHFINQGYALKANLNSREFDANNFSQER